jgi:membrane protein YqaA with SNARE-associated domain
MGDIAAYAGLFVAAFAAATILPMQSEAVLVGLLLADYSPPLVVAVASVGNVLGSIVNWLLGRGIERFRDRRWFRRARPRSNAPRPGIAATENGRCCSVGFLSSAIR